MSKEKVIGIDLASSQSVVAVIENGEPKVIVNSEGSRTTPSVIMIKDGERKIGGAAKRQVVMNPKNTITYIKRYMGGKYDDPDIQKMIKMSTYKVDNDGGLPRINIDGKKYSPEEISSYIISYLKKAAEDYYGCEVKKAVITCPAYYNDSQRQAVKLAGELAGLQVLRIINEPTSAILAANYKLKDDEEKNIMVVDLGGATLDVTIANLSNIDNQLMVEVLASNGNVFLGGQNYDNAIVNWAAEEFAKEHSGFDLRKDPMAYSRLIEASEKAKCELSSSAQSEINLPYITVIDNVPQMLVLTLTRAKFEQLTDNLTQQVIDTARKCIEKSGKSLSDINSILLVGGSTRMLSVQNSLTKEFNIKLDKSVNPDEAVALGAVKQANIIIGGEGADDLLLLDVTPISLGIETEGSVMTKLIEANTTIPTSKSQIFSTAIDNQNAVTIQVLQGERPMANDNKLIGTFNLDGIAPARRGVPQIEVKFDIDANGILTVSAKDKATNKEQHITIENQNSLSKEEIDKIKAEAEKFKEEDLKKETEIKQINTAESYAYSIEETLNNKDFSDLMTDDEKTKINEKLKIFNEKIASKNIKDIETSEKELKEVYDPIITRIYKNTQQNSSDNTSSNPFGFNANTTSNTSTNNDEVPFEEAKN